MAVSEAHKKASNKWNSSRDNIMIRPTTDEGRVIRAAATHAGQTLQQYILQAIRERMEREVTTPGGSFHISDRENSEDD